MIYPFDIPLSNDSDSKEGSNSEKDDNFCEHIDSDFSFEYLNHKHECNFFVKLSELGYSELIGHSECIASQYVESGKHKREFRYNPEIAKKCFFNCDKRNLLDKLKILFDAGLEGAIDLLGEDVEEYEDESDDDSEYEE